jgi:hypothetical protein
MVTAAASEVKVAVAAAIASGAYQQLANGVIQGTTMVNGAFISFTGFVNSAGQVFVSNVMGGFPK